MTTLGCTTTLTGKNSGKSNSSTNSSRCKAPTLSQLPALSEPEPQVEQGTNREISAERRWDKYMLKFLLRVPKDEKVPANSRMSMTNELPKNPSLGAADKTRMFAEAKVGRNTVQRNREASDWDFRRDGLLFWQDVEEAHRLKREDPDAFKSSIRARKIAAFVEDSLVSQRALEREFENNIPSALRDLSVARNPKRTTKERLAAIDRFAKSFSKIPVNAAIALFRWLDGGNKNDVIQALGRTVVTLTINPQTGDLTEAERRGRKRRSATVRRIELAARLSKERISERKMAARLFPNLPQDKAYARTRDLFHDYRYWIAILARRI